MGKWSFTVEQLEKHFGGTGLSGLEKYFIEYGEEWKVNPMFLAAIAAFESTWGRSEIATKQNNLFGRSKETSSGVFEYMTFNSKEECIRSTAQHLSNNYLSVGLKTFESIGAKFCPPGDPRDVHKTNSSWPSQVKTIYTQISGEDSSKADLGEGIPGSGSTSTSNVGSATISNPTIFTTTSFKTNPETDFLLSPTEDERKYGINIYEGEQPLIKFSTYGAITSHGGPTGALKKYAEFLYYLLNSEVTTAQISCIGMPWIRPGFNVWYAPLGADAVYYCIGVQHQGDAVNGGTTVLTLVLGRDRKAFIRDSERFGSFKSKSDNVFISEMKDEYRATSFGKCLNYPEIYDSIRNAAEKYYGSPSYETADAKDSQYHKNLYVDGADSSPVPPNINKNKIFTGQYTKEKIKEQLSALYSEAPEVVKSRGSQLKTVVNSARKYMDKYNLLEKHKS